ncbi:MAG: O-antigen ligase domain-containing protein [Rhodanobacter sp.]|nr:MAG: O-antigen ligase domain-containing protein [Rhodanobacter sp.]
MRPTRTEAGSTTTVDEPSGAWNAMDMTVKKLPPADLRRRWMVPAYGQYLLGVGLAWVMLGMLIMPAGVSFNPSKAFQKSLILLLYLPALWLICKRFARVRAELWPQATFRVFLLLLAWALLSLLWADLRRPADELGRIVSVTLFVLGWFVWNDPEQRRGLTLLRYVTCGTALCAGWFVASFLLSYHNGERIVGDGVVATANYAAAVMGVATVWAVQLAPPSARWNAVRWVAVALLLGFVALTDTRSVWLALALCIALSPLWSRRLAAKVGAVLVLLGGAALALFLPSPLGSRGMSLRPQIFEDAVALIRTHPWLGLGQGTPFQLEVNGQYFTHSHNLFTQAAIELGLPGLLLTLVLWLLIGWQGWRQRALPQGRLLLSTWIFASVVLQFDMPQLLDSPRPGWLLIWLPLGLALGLGARAHATARRPEPLH